MPAAPLPDNEAARLQALHDLEILDSGPDSNFDALVRLAASFCGVPISAISLVDTDRQWFKAIVGLDASETPRDVAFCAHALDGSTLLEVPDARLDERFADNPLVTDDPRIRFYAGAPLTLDTGECIGTLCVIDTQPGALTELQRSTLMELARVATLALQTQRHIRTAAEALAARDRTLALLDAQRTRLETVVEAAGAGTLEWNVQTGELLLNTVWAQLLGWPADAPLPTHVEALRERVHPEDQARSRELFDALFRGQIDRYDYELRMRHAEGHWVWLHSRGRLISRTPSGEPEWFYGLHTNITARKQAELALIESREIMDVTGRAAGIGGWHVDLDTQALHWTDETCRIHGLAPGHRPDIESAINFYAPEAQPLIQAAVQRGLETGEGWDLELPLIRADGKRIWVRATGQAQFEAGRARRLIGAFQDITVRKQAQIALEEKHELLRVTLESIGDGVITTDAEGGVTWMNPVASSLTGVPAHQALGQPVEAVFRVLEAETRAPMTVPVRAALERKAVVALADNAVLCAADGVEHGVEDSAAPILAGDGQVMGAVLVFHDVTEQRLALRSLREREVAERANRAKTEFLSRLSHELRTPLNAILGFISLLQMKPGISDAERAEWLGHVQTAGSHLLGLVDDVLDVSRIEAGAMQLSVEPVDVRELAEEVVRLLRPQAAARAVRLVIEPREQLGERVQADLKRLRQVLFNLVTNAIKYNREGGAVYIRITPVDGRCELSVRDQGLGMNAEQVARLFQPFERLGRAGDGVGLGLVITRLLVSIMGGAIEVTSSPGVGTTFVVRLPLAQQADALTAASPAAARSGTATVLALDPIED
ncbi:MAG TPA: PAS domain-containing protein, partial [Burkholderiaceae bacterium]|nr:PAS domain-containing protein [Burkholderiaceae bacterium]